MVELTFRRGLPSIRGIYLCDDDTMVLTVEERHVDTVVDAMSTYRHHWTLEMRVNAPSPPATEG